MNSLTGPDRTAAVKAIAYFAAIAFAAVGCSSSAKSGSSTPTTGAARGHEANTASAPGVTPSTITIGYITSKTGVASSSFSDGFGGAMARISLQNAQGGVDGRKIQLVQEDDTSSPNQNEVAAADLVEQKDVFAVIDYSSFTFGAARYLNREGVPVVGNEFDGPEWGEQPNTNMFTFIPPYLTPYDGTYYNWNYDGVFLKSLGVTKIAGLAYGNSPSATEALKGELAATESSGIDTCYKDLSVPFGATDFTAAALAVKASSCDGVFAPMVDTSDVALSEAVKNTGIKATQLYATGYDQAVLDNPSAETALNGDYFKTELDFSSPSPEVQTMLNALKTYDPSYKGGIPDYGLWGSYIAADLLIKGLQVAGQNPTRQSFVSNLRQVTNYTAGGLLPSPTSFTNFGTKAMLPQTACFHYVRLEGSRYVPAAGGKAVCGHLIPVT